MEDWHSTVTIRLKDSKPVYGDKFIILPPKLLSLLKGKGDKGEITIYKHDLVYK